MARRRCKLHTIGGLTNDKEGSFMKFVNKQKMSKQLKLFKEEELPVWVNEVPFVSEVETFNETFGKPNNYEPTIPRKKRMAICIRFHP